MTDLLRSISQPEYDQIAHEFFDETGKYHGTPYFRFHRSVQERLLAKLQESFKEFGYTLERTKDNCLSDYMVYEWVDKRSKKVLSEKLNLSILLGQLLYINDNKYPGIPDVRIVRPDYLDARLAEINQTVMNSFKEIISPPPILALPK